MDKDCSEVHKIITEWFDDIDGVKKTWKYIGNINPDFEQVSEENWRKKEASLWLHGETEPFKAIEFEKWLMINAPISGQCIWGFINGIDNTKEEALASATLISQSSKGERVLSMPNDTIWQGIDLLVCGVLKVSIDTPLVTWTVKFLRHLLTVAGFEIEPTPVIVFAHSQGAIYIEHALELLSPQERQQLRVFTFGGGSFIEPEKAHPDSHNYASAADYVCRLASPNLQCLALKRYYGLKSGLNEEQIIHQLAYEDAILSLDSIDPKTVEMYTESRKKIYEKEFSKIKHITILDPDPGTNWKHEFGSECYQATVQNIIRKYQK